MILLSEPWAWWAIYGMAIVCGALGGFVAELLLRGAAGQIEIPGTVTGKGLLDLGFWANVIVGATAAAAALLFFQPGVVQVGGIDVQAYELRTIIGLSIIVGSAGGAVIAAMQEKVIALLKAKEADDLAKLATKKINELEAMQRNGQTIPEQSFEDARTDIEAMRM